MFKLLLNPNTYPDITGHKPPPSCSLGPICHTSAWHLLPLSSGSNTSLTLCFCIKGENQETSLRHVIKTWLSWPTHKIKKESKHWRSIQGSDKAVQPLSCSVMMNSLYLLAECSFARSVKNISIDGLEFCCLCAVTCLHLNSAITHWWRSADLSVLFCGAASRTLVLLSCMFVYKPVLCIKGLVPAGGWLS